MADQAPQGEERPRRTTSFAQLQVTAYTPVILEIATEHADELGSAVQRVTGEVMTKTRSRLALCLESVYLGKQVEQHALRVVLAHPRYGLISFRPLSAVLHHPLIWLEAPTEVEYDRNPRGPYTETVVVDTGQASLRCPATNLGVGGICVKLPAYVPGASSLAEGMTCHIFIGQHIPIHHKLAARLVWRKGELAGFNFINLTHHEESALIVYTTQLAWTQQKIEEQRSVRSDVVKE